MTVVDVGANLGYFSLLAARARRVRAAGSSRSNRTRRTAGSCCRRCGEAGSPTWSCCRWRRTTRRAGRTLDPRGLERRLIETGTCGALGVVVPRSGSTTSSRSGRVLEDGRGGRRGPRVWRGPRGSSNRTARSSRPSSRKRCSNGVEPLGGRLPRLFRGPRVPAVVVGQARPAPRRRIVRRPSCWTTGTTADELRDVLLLPSPADLAARRILAACRSASRGALRAVVVRMDRTALDPPGPVDRLRLVAVFLAACGAVTAPADAEAPSPTKVALHALLHFPDSFAPQQVALAAAGRPWVLGARAPSALTGCDLWEVTPSTLATRAFALPALPHRRVRRGRGSCLPAGERRRGSHETHPRLPRRGLRPGDRPGAGARSGGAPERRQRRRGPPT